MGIITMLAGLTASVLLLIASPHADRNGDDRVEKGTAERSTVLPKSSRAIPSDTVDGEGLDGETRIDPPAKTTVHGYDPNYGAYTLQNLTPINSENLEYSPSVSADGSTLYFVSNRAGGQGGHDVWVTAKPQSRDGAFSSPIPLGESINSRQNEGVVSISADGSALYVTACNREDGLGDCDIYVAERQGEEWGELHPVPNVNSEFWDSQPSISGSVHTLYFVSNRVGVMGGKDDADIYMAVRGTDGTWSAPQNLGAGINTVKREDSPFILPGSDKLYFASSGRGGEGKLDFFVAQPDEYDQWREPKSLGPVFNTPFDERFITVLPNEGVIYFASERTDLKNLGTLDIFMATVNPEVLSVAERRRFALSAYPNPATDYATVTSSEDVPLPAEILLTDARGNVVLREKASALPYRLKVEDLPNGLYLARIGDAVAPIVVRN